MTASRDPAEQPIRALMSDGIVSIEPATAVGRARELMLGLGIHCLPVVDDAGTVVGFVTSSDLVEEWPFGEPVTTIMSARVFSVDAATSVAKCARRMLTDRVHHLLVTDKGEPVGVVSSFDMLTALATGETDAEADG